MHLDNKKGLLLCSPRPYRRFSYSFRPRGESATFLFATMLTTTQKHFLVGIEFQYAASKSNETYNFDARRSKSEVAGAILGTYKSFDVLHTLDSTSAYPLTTKPHAFTLCSDAGPTPYKNHSFILCTLWRAKSRTFTPRMKCV